MAVSKKHISIIACSILAAKLIIIICVIVIIKCKYNIGTYSYLHNKPPLGLFMKQNG